MKVNIPKKFFLTEAKNEYWDFQSRLVCEAIQNSVDSGASRIDIEFGSDSMLFMDNGKGMSKEVMESAMLTMGGSAKESGNTGGFGAAKKILLFAHKSYQIHSLSTLAEGSCLDYEFIDNEPINGTSIKITPYEEFNYSMTCMTNYAKAFLKKCNLKCDVYVNGELFDNYLVLPKVRETDMMEISASEERETGDSIYVRKNGLFMFSRYLTDLGQSVVCEVKQDSKTAFSQSRDSLKGKCNSEFSSLVDELNLDKFSFSVKGIKKRLFRGKKAFISFINKILDTKSDILKPEEKAQIEEVYSKVQSSSPETLSNPETAFDEIRGFNVEEDIVEKIKEEYHKEYKSDISYDFLVDLCNSKYSDVPEEFHPDTMSQENTQTALLWKHCILEVVKICELDLNFAIGFTLSEKAEAIFHKDGANYLLINPTILAGEWETMDGRFLKILLVAIHELIHCCYGKRYHDEQFALLFENVVTKVLLKINKAEIWSKVEEDKL